MGNLKSNITLFLKGMAMGGADVVPGVSGGTIAFITGIYEELILSIRSINLQTIRLLISGDFEAFWKSINGAFLLRLLSGILVSIFSLAKGITYALEHYPIQIWSFFFGLVLISAIVVVRNIRRWSVVNILFIILGAAVAYLITSFSPATSPETIWFVFLSGAIAICAMILPGISGSFILVLLGKYEYILTAVKTLDLLVIAIFAAGCVVGILSFARLISWMFDKFHDLTIALLAGFMLGSLNKVWPWKEVLQYRINSKGEQTPLFDRNVSPAEYMDITGNDPFLMQAVMFIALGLLIVIVIERLASASKSQE